MMKYVGGPLDGQDVPPERQRYWNDAAQEWRPVMRIADANAANACDVYERVGDRFVWICEHKDGA